MRTPILAGNWKMYKSVAEAIELAKAMAPGLAAIQGAEKVLCPAHVALQAVRDAVAGTDVQVGAQNMHWEEEGAFTGEISPLMLQDLCTHVVLGHSERRAFFGENDAGVNQKARTALSHGLIPIICVGENLEQREAGQTESWITGQVQAALADLTAQQVQQVVIAYEPIWAIGTGVPASPADASAVIGGAIRRVLKEDFGEATAEAVRIQYGGSVKPENVAGFMEQPDIDGALVGGASLKSDVFVELVRIAAEVKSKS
jgi:triosephosphate isomerase